MADHPNTFADVWQRIPPVTRYLGSIAVCLYALYLVYPYWAIKFWLLPNSLAQLQLWRLFTAPLSYQGERLSGLLAVYQFCSDLSMLELQYFKTTSDLIVYVVFLSTIFITVGPRIGVSAFISGLVSAMTYTLAQEDPYAPQQLFVVQIQRAYLPWAHVLLGFVTGGLYGTYVPLLGIFSGHLHLFLTQLLPLYGGPTLLRPPPWLSARIDKVETVANDPPRYGRGHRLT